MWILTSLLVELVHALTDQGRGPQALAPTSDQTWNLASGIIGGILGALAGGIPAYFIAERGSKIAAERDKEVQLDRNAATLQSAFVKLLEIHDCLKTLRLNIDEMIADTAQRYEEGTPLWQRVTPMIGIPAAEWTRFDSAEIALFMGNENEDVFASLLIHAQRNFAALMALVTLYGERRTELMAMLPLQPEGNGRFHARVNQTEVPSVAHRAAELEKMMIDINEAVRADEAAAADLCAQFNERAASVVPGRRVPNFGRQLEVGAKP